MSEALEYLSIVGVVRMVDDAGGALVAQPHLKPLLLQWAASQGFTELDAHTAIGDASNNLLHCICISFLLFSLLRLMTLSISLLLTAAYFLRDQETPCSSDDSASNVKSSVIVAAQPLL